MKSKGKLYVMSGPSGVGKSTIIKRLLELRSNIFFSVSATTRSPREGEVNGVNYLFITEDKFKRMIDEDQFVEYANYVGNYYGTPIAPIMEQLEKGNDALLDIEVQGKAQVKAKIPEAITIFIAPPSFEILEHRLRKRSTDSEEKIIKRLETAKKELALAPEYDYTVVNDDFNRAAMEIISIMDSEK